MCKGKMELPSKPIVDQVIDHVPAFLLEKDEALADSRKMVFEDTKDMQEFKLVVNTYTNLKIYVEKSITSNQKIDSYFTQVLKTNCNPGTQKL